MVGFRIDLVRVLHSTPFPAAAGEVPNPEVTFLAVGVCRFRARAILGHPIN